MLKYLENLASRFIVGQTDNDILLNIVFCLQSWGKSFELFFFLLGVLGPHLELSSSANPRRWERSH